MIGILAEDYSKKLLKGSIVEIAEIKKCCYCKTGYWAKVVDEWSRPKWLDLSWFKSIKSGKKVKITVKVYE